MEERGVSVVIISRNRSKAKFLNISRKIIYFGIASILANFSLIVGLAVFSAKSYSEYKKYERYYAHVREENTYLRNLLELKTTHIEKLKSEKEELKKKISMLEENIEEFENYVEKINRFLRKKGIRKIPKGIGGASYRSEKFIDTDYLSFLKKEFRNTHKILSDIPLGFPVFGRITSKFGYRRDPFNGKIDFHRGVDIRAPYGTPVRSTASGKVIYAGWLGPYGKAVVIKHKYGYQTLYGHLSKIKVRAGQRVKEGQIIGYVGSTGRSTGPHLHYEIRRYGKLLNPKKYLFVRWD